MSTHFIVYGKPGCPFCTKALELIDTNGDTRSYIDVSKNPDKRQFLIDNGLGTVPQIYIEDENQRTGCLGLNGHVGGFTDLTKWYQSR